MLGAQHFSKNKAYIMRKVTFGKPESVSYHAWGVDTDVDIFVDDVYEGRIQSHKHTGDTKKGDWHIEGLCKEYIEEGFQDLRNAKKAVISIVTSPEWQPNRGQGR